MSSSAFVASPAFIISHATPEARAIRSSTCGSSDNVLFLRSSCSSSSVRMSLEIQLPTSLVGYVGIELGGGEIGMPEHFLNRSEICSSLEEVRSKRVTKQVWVNATRVEPRHLGQFAEDQEGAGAGERPAARVQEELRAVPRVEERPPA